MGSTDEQPTSELVADLLDTARASRARTMQEVAEAWQRAGTITRNLILMASSEIGSIERPATDLVTQLRRGHASDRQGSIWDAPGDHDFA
jgi:hypothetical protein